MVKAAQLSSESRVCGRYSAVCWAATEGTAERLPLPVALFSLERLSFGRVWKVWAKTAGLPVGFSGQPLLRKRTAEGASRKSADFGNQTILRNGEVVEASGFFANFGSHLFLGKGTVASASWILTDLDDQSLPRKRAVV
jgi:hypothetical protein